MKYRSRYPKNWNEIALQVKQEAKWQCQMCGLRCIPSNKKIAGINRSERAKYRLEVHHINRKPEDNRRSNLIALCSACHLRQHRRGCGSVPVGQMKLDFQM